MGSSNHLSLTRYQQGEWFGVVRNGTVVLLGPDTPHALIDTVWELLASAPEAHEVLHEVTEAFGVSLSRIPPFGIIDSKDALRVFLRGDLELVVQLGGGLQLGGGEERLTGRDVTTWTERRIADATAYSARIGDGTAVPAGIPTAGGSLPVNSSPLNSLPLGEGVVLLASLDASAEAAGHTESEPEVRPATVSDETMIGYTEADLGLTIAPGHMINSTGSSTTAEDAVAEGPGVAEVHGIAPLAAPEEPEVPPAAPVDPVTEEAHANEDPAVPEAPKKSEEPAEPEESAVPEESVVPEEPAEPEEPASGLDSEVAGVPVHTSTTDPMVPSLENTTSYDHLWDKTVMRNIEDAAVRSDDGSEDHDSPASPAPEDQTPPTPAPPSAAPVSAPPASAPHIQTEDVSAAAPSTGLIDSVPWLRSGSSTPESGSDQQVAPPRPAPVPSPQVPAAWLSAPQGSPVDEDSDHDGQTIMKSSLPAAADGGAKAAVGGPETPAVVGPSVLARMCSQGHANPPTYPQCSVCGVPVTGDAVHVPRPRLGRMRLSTGELIDLDQSLIIGRQPSVSRVQGGTMPRLIQVDSPGGDISRSHVEVRLEGWHVMLCDLKATNGTVLIREGQAPRRLAQNEMAILLDGDIAELGDNISLRFEEIL
ncbi:FHA domain-containing protein [Paenarthrobacter sp. MSM-2-10-13]|uniref:FHA domain-containing protein n=1 Tax=Paenarthrobacter sp. MSM-2-10-13 TaxID=2717318 RepID=UPI001424547E|nr:FHA domain-containing protein [Paenarthrobacter sp. MSM-2-10-13]NHW49337.1 FHA domain-containing protein [Paenarthrobacter sp. MSM-2-10-13]